MATFKICVFEHQKREDSKYPISIRVTNNRKCSYIKTGLYASRADISKNFDYIKNTELARIIDRKVEEYENFIKVHVGVGVNDYSAKELCDFIKNYDESRRGVNFSEFARSHIEQLKKSGSESYALNMMSVVNQYEDFFGKANIDIKEITVKNLELFANYLRSTRRLERKNQFGQIVIREYPPISERSLADYMKHIRTLFNAAINKFNDEDNRNIAITHYPFRKFKIKTNHEVKKRNLSVEVIKSIRDMKIDENNKRSILAQDVFMLSFYTVGTNLVDLYSMGSICDNRLSYNRSKTNRRRSDNAYISINIEPEASIIIDKYKSNNGGKAFCFSELYSTHQNFVRAVNEGLKQICESLELDISVTSYYARHSWATIARNTCRIPLEDINLALNHVDQDMKTTDIYIAKDFSLIDQANRKVLDLLR